MATVVNNPQPSSGSGNGFIVGIILLIVVAVIFIYFGLPLFRGTGTQVNLPSTVNVQTK